MRDAGFVDVRSEDVALEFAFESAREYVEFIAHVAPPVTALLQRLDEDKKAKLRNALETTVAERFGAAGSVLIPSRAVLLTAASP